MGVEVISQFITHNRNIRFKSKYTPDYTLPSSSQIYIIPTVDHGLSSAKNLATGHLRCLHLYRRRCRRYYRPACVQKDEQGLQTSPE